MSLAEPHPAVSILPSIPHFSNSCGALSSVPVMPKYSLMS